MTQKELATAVGKTRAAVAQWEAGNVRPRHTTLLDIAKATNQSMEWLVSGKQDKQVGIVVIGNLAAGIWLESAAHYEEKSMPVAPHPSYPAEAQRLWRIQGNSSNKIANDGEYIHSVSLAQTDIALRNGDLVIVRRADQERSEYTLRRLSIRDGEWELHPETDDSQWQEILVLDGHKRIEITIIDLVIAKWSPISRGS